jgi:multidrug resistance efflux pump
MSTVMEASRPVWRRRLIMGTAAAGLIAMIVGARSIVHPHPTYTVRGGDIVHRFVAQGRVECNQTVDVFPEVSAVIRSVLVNEGDRVTEGQTLVELDDASLQAAHSEAVHAAAAAQARWEELKGGTRQELIDAAKAQVLMLEAQWEAAKAKEQEVLRGPRAEEIEQALQLLEAAKAEEETAQAQYERAKKLKAGDLSPSELEEFALRATGSRKTRLAREAQWKLLTAGASAEEKDQAKAAVKAAFGRLRQAQAELNRLRKGPSLEEKQAAEALYHQAEAAVERARIALGNTRIRSPMSGIVLRRFHHPGELVHPQIPLPLLVLCDDAERELRIEIMEGDVYKVRTGQDVLITSESYVGSRWRGRITRLAPVMGRKRLMSEHPREKTDVKVLEAWVLPDEKLDLPINVPVEVTAEVVIRHDVPIVPWRCVSPADRTVKLSDGTVRMVELGARDDGYVEVVSGLQVGDRLLMPNR